MKEKLKQLITRKDGNPNSVMMKALFKNPVYQDYANAINNYLSSETKDLGESERIWLYLNGFTDARRCSHGVPLKFQDMKRNYTDQHCSCVKDDFDLIRVELMDRMKTIPYQQLAKVLKNPRYKHGLDTYAPNRPIAEQYYLFVNEETPKVCRYGNPALFKSIESGYSVNCKTKGCTCKDDNHSEYLKKYYIDNPDKAKEQGIKLQTAFREEYGDNPHSNPEFRNKVKATMVERYGVDTPFASEEIRSKAKQTTLKNHGVEYALQSKDIQKQIWENQKKVDPTMSRARQAFLERNNGLNPFVVFKDKIDDHWESLGVKHNKQLVFPRETVEILEDKEKFIEFIGGHDISTIMTNLRISERTFRRYVDEYECEHITSNPSRSDIERLLDAKLEKHDIHYIKSNRSLLKDLELDFYFPEHNFAVELNGLYWHRDEVKGEEYHKIKHDRCAEIGIKLFQYWEDECNDKMDIIVNNILAYTNIIVDIEYTIEHDLHKEFILKYELKDIEESDYSIVGRSNGEIVTVFNIKVVDGDHYVTNKASTCRFSQLPKDIVEYPIYMFCDNNRDITFGTILDEINPSHYYTDCRKERRLSDKLPHTVHNSGGYLFIINM